VTDEFAHLSDDELIVRGIHAAADRARLEGAELHEAGFRLTKVVGTDAMFWKKEGMVYTTAAALTEAGIIPEADKEETE